MRLSTTLSLPNAPYPKSATLHVDNQHPPRACLLYFHGGGLLFGHRDDLPEAYVDQWTREGFALLCLDYPLAPASAIADILRDAEASVLTYLEKRRTWLGASLPCLLWGRSAGAYLALLVATRVLPEAPLALLSYYGYGLLTDGWFNQASPYYLRQIAIDARCLEALPQEVHAEGALDRHYAAYVYARQQGCWPSLLYQGPAKYFYRDFSLRGTEHLSCPLFCAHSLHDPDVPFAESKALHDRFGGDLFVATGSTHDFDREPASPQAQRLFEASLRFVEKRLG